MIRRWAFALAPLTLLLSMAYCGGGGAGSTFTSPSNPSTPPSSPALSITSSTTLPAGVEGKSYSVQLQASGGTIPYKWTLDAGAPTWLSIDSQTGVLTGSVPATNPIWVSAGYTVPVVVTDSATPAQVAKKSLNMNAVGQIALMNPFSGAGTTGIAFSASPEVAGGVVPYTFSVDAGLPPGLQLASNATVPGSALFQGTPTLAGTFNTQLHVKDSSTPPQAVALPISFVIDSKLAIVNTAVKTIVSGRAYSYQMAAVNGTPPFAWTAQGLPSGLTIDTSTGLITGTTDFPGGDGGLFFTVKDSGSPQQTATKSGIFYATAPLAFKVAGPLQGNVNTAFNELLLSLGGIPPTNVITSGTLPPGLTLSYGSLSGTPTQTGTYAFTITATDSDTPPVTIQNAYTFTVFTPVPVTSAQSLPLAVIGRPYSAKLWARDGMLPYTWSVAGGQLPPGLSLDAAGNITGTPLSMPAYNQTGFTFTAAVTDAASPAQTAKANYTITVSNSAKGRNDSIATATPASYPGLSASLSPFTDPPGSTTSAPDTDYYRVSAKAGTVVDVYVGSNNTVDPVIEIVDANGQRFKTCQDPGDDNPTLTFIVKDTTPTAYDDECLNDDVDPTVNRSADLKFQVPGATGTQMTFYVHVFDSSGNARPDMTYQLSLGSAALPPLTIDPQALPGASLGAAYSANLAGGGGLPPWAWQLASGSLPPGLVVANDASKGWVISGTPTAKGSFDFALSLTDAETPPQTQTRQYNISVYDPLVIATDKFPDLTAGQPYSYTIPVTGGVPPYQWSSYSMVWCCLTMNQSTGEWTNSSKFTGTTTQTFSNTVNVTDATGRTTSKTLTLTVSP